jgi:hypothetical protein
MADLRATDVFVPTDFPTYTYVARDEERLEKALRNAFETPKTAISVSGPSKSGKTVLVQRVLGEDNIIPIYGAQISSPEEVWSAILNWIEAPSSVTEGTGASESITPNATASAKVKVPGLAEIGFGGGLATQTGSNSARSVTIQSKGLAAVAREIANGDFTVFLDDFHYIARDLQEDVGKQIKAGVEVGIRFCVASVPHRADDVVRSNHELRGRTINIDTNFWSLDDLVQIGTKGFETLNIQVGEEIIRRLAEESCTSPQIMQALCLQLCFELGVREGLPNPTKFNIDKAMLQSVLEQTSGRADYTSLLKQMHAGPRIRGTERKTFKFVDGSEGDAYRSVLLALTADPPLMELNYAEITRRIDAVCIDEKPVGSSVTESYKQIEGFARSMYPNQRILEWDADAASGTLSIIDPYFLFFIRSSDRLASLANKSDKPTLPLFENVAPGLVGRPAA